MLIGMFGHIEADDTRTSLCELTYVTAQPNAAVAMIQAPRGICLSSGARAGAADKQLVFNTPSSKLLSHLNS